MTPPTATQARPTARPLLIFDGDCAFCTSSVNSLAELLPASPELVPYQRADLSQYGLTEQDAAEQVWLIDGDRQYGGYLAVATMFKRQPNLLARFLGELADTPPWSFASGVVYALVARYRQLLPGGTPACRP